MDNSRSPMDNLMTMLSGLSTGHEKALKQGIYNAVALFLLCIVVAAGYGLYIVLSPFVKPLVWALLCGSVLFPFKLTLTTIVQSWFTRTEASHRPLVVNLVMIPVHIVEHVSEVIGSFLRLHLKYIFVTIAIGVITLIIYNYTPYFLTCLTWKVIKIFNIFLGLIISMCNIYTLTGIVIGYLSILHLHWTPTNSGQFRYYSLFIWFMMSLYMSNAVGTYPVLIFCTLQVLFFIGFIYEVIVMMVHHETEGKKSTLMEMMRSVLTSENTSSSQKLSMTSLVEDEMVELDGRSETPESDEHRITRLTATKPFLKFTGRSATVDTGLGKPSSNHESRRSRSTCNVLPAGLTISDHYFLRKLRTELRMSLDIEGDKVDTDKYMYGAAYCCIGMLMWKHRWIMYILVLPIAYYLLKQVGSFFGFWKIILIHCSRLCAIVGDWCQERHQALIPINVRGLYKVSIIFDQKLTQILKASIDTVATIAVIVGLLIFVTCASIFIIIQVYGEGMHLIQVSGEILNSTLVHNPDIDWVPQEWEDSVNSVLDNAYTYGRSAISDGVRSLVKNLEPAKAEQMEKKVLELWDRLYQAWMMSNDNGDMIGPTVDSTAAFTVWESFKDGFGKMPLQLFNMTSIQNFAKENVGVLISVLDSIWSIVKGNLSVVLTIFTELTWIVLMSGSAVLNFSLSMVVFFTALFYLLSSSGKTYKPIELVTSYSPIGCHNLPDAGGFAMALQEAVIGVFAATFKIASFFGMWTWFAHNLFQVKIVYLPSAFATVLGAVPFLDAYVACIPATIELWFTRGSFVAVTFFMVHFLPCNIVITEFYKEIKGGGHPYLTGLSIAGGIFCLGVEGAIFGPLLLCCIMVAINLSRRYLQTPSAETINTIQSQISKLET